VKKITMWVKKMMWLSGISH